MSTAVMLICPHCKHRQDVVIPDNKSLPFHLCVQCRAWIVARETHCVICEYTDKRCPTHVTEEE